MWKTYYYAGSQLIALRVLTQTGNTLYYLHSDHLGSTSLSTDANGAEVPNSRQSYYPFGEIRVPGNGLPTDIAFTGQRKDSYINLYQMGARWYDQDLGRWISPDTIIPDGQARVTPLTVDFHEFAEKVGEENRLIEKYGPFFQWSEQVRKEHPVPMGPSNPQALNRYSYALNNPLKYTDPSGHTVRCTSDLLYCTGAVVHNDSSRDILVRGTRINKDGSWEDLTVRLKPGQSSLDLGIVDADFVFLGSVTPGMYVRKVSDLTDVSITDDPVDIDHAWAAAQDTRWYEWERLTESSWVDLAMIQDNAGSSIGLSGVVYVRDLFGGLWGTFIGGASGRFVDCQLSPCSVVH
jgi:RHS repeat-associated protein